VKVIYTSKREEIIVDDDDYEKFGGMRWYLSSGYPSTGRLDGANGIDRLSRLIMGLERGDRVRVDYINGDLLDNRKENLRVRVTGRRPTLPSGSKKAQEAIAKKEADWAELAKTPQAIVTQRGNEVRYSVDDWPILCRHLWLENTQGYAYCNMRNEGGGRRKVLMHRLILGIEDNSQLEGDHINRNRLDNRRENLRTCTPAENTRNIGVPRHNTSGYKGVSFHKATGKWQAAIGSGKKGSRTHLGIFPTAEEAYAVYCDAARKRFGEFASFD
jgi:hypothetical protein